MPLFEIRLQFAVVGTSPNDNVAYFLSLAPYMWKDMCADRINYTVVSCKQPTETDLVLTLDVKPRSDDLIVSDTDMRSVGIRNPEMTRTYTDLYYWIQSLRTMSKGPLYDAWRLFCSQQGIEDVKEVPIILLKHVHSVLQHASLDTPVQFPSPDTIDSGFADPLQLEIIDFNGES